MNALTDIDDELRRAATAFIAAAVVVRSTPAKDYELAGLVATLDEASVMIGRLRLAITDALPEGRYHLEDTTVVRTANGGLHVGPRDAKVTPFRELDGPSRRW